MKRVLKGSFTLVEMIVSITIFSIIFLFLYQALDISQKTNDTLKNKTEQRNRKNLFLKQFGLDILTSKVSSLKTEIEEKQTILQINTKNTMHNPFYSNVTYMLSENGNLMRIESRNKFQKNNISFDFLEKAYIDLLLKGVEKFYVEHKQNTLMLYIRFKDENLLVHNFNIPSKG